MGPRHVPLAGLLLLGCSGALAAGPTSNDEVRPGQESASGTAPQPSGEAAARQGSEDACYDEVAARAEVACGTQRAGAAAEHGDPLAYDETLIRDYSAAARAGRSEPREEDWNPQPLSTEGRRVIDQATTLICAATANRDSPDASRRGLTPDVLVKLQFERARMFYDANRWETAAPLLLDVVFSATPAGTPPVAPPSSPGRRSSSGCRPENCSSGPLAVCPCATPPQDPHVYAAQLYLDALNLIATRRSPERPACMSEMERRIPEIRARLCTPSTAPQSASNGDAHAASVAAVELCDLLVVLECQLGRRRAEAMAEDAAYCDASSAYESLARTCSDRRDEALYNAAITAERCGDAPRARDLRLRLRSDFPESPLNSAR